MLELLREALNLLVFLAEGYLGLAFALLDQLLQLFNSLLEPVIIQIEVPINLAFALNCQRLGLFILISI